jgi:hypothetical protein
MNAVYLRRLALLIFAMIALACENANTTNSASHLDRTDNDDTPMVVQPVTPVVQGATIDSFTKDSVQPKKQ